MSEASSHTLLWSYGFCYQTSDLTSILTLRPAWRQKAALSAHTYGSQDVTRDVVPRQVHSPQGSVAGETVHQGPAPQEANVIPAQVWKET